MKLTPELSRQLPDIIDLHNKGLSSKDIGAQLNLEKGMAMKVINALPKLIRQMEVIPA